MYGILELDGMESAFAISTQWKPEMLSVPLWDQFSIVIIRNMLLSVKSDEDHAQTQGDGALKLQPTKPRSQNLQELILKSNFQATTTKCKPELATLTDAVQLWNTKH